MTAKEYQEKLHPILSKIFYKQDVKNEWSAFIGRPYQYSPRVDIAIGPFNTESGNNLINTYDDLVKLENNMIFLQAAFKKHKENFDLSNYDEIIHPEFKQLIHKNQNSRCFIALEIENKNSKKHIMGSIVNASSLGRIGIGIAFNDTTLKTFCRILNYLSFLKRVDKNTYDTTNFLILTVPQLDEIIDGLDKKQC